MHLQLSRTLFLLGTTGNHNILEFGMQLDEEEKYLAKMEAGLYTLQVGVCRSFNWDAVVVTVLVL